jgi:muramoyltetrapeptide carboxypeptidase
MNKRKFLKNLALGIGAVPLFSSNSRSFEHEMTLSLLPKGIKKGDWVGLVSPSAAASERIQYQFAKEALEALGFKVKLSQHLQNRRGHLAGTDAERANDLNGMFKNPDIKAIICMRGGSGANRILPLIDYEAVKANPKPLLGYSDITALHLALHAQTGLISFHGPNGSGSWNSFNVKQFEKVFFNKELVTFENEISKEDDLVIKRNRIVIAVAVRI